VYASPLGLVEDVNEAAGIAACSWEPASGLFGSDWYVVGSIATDAITSECWPLAWLAVASALLSLITGIV
jgi:hypothetical protein